MSDFRETLYTIDSHGHRKWVYLTDITGFFRTRRSLVAAVLLLIYLSMPWITIHGAQAVFLDILHRRFVFFGSTFWATDTKFLFLALASLGLCLFFFTALFGRVWCGWACPETVFLEFVFRPIERWIEGGPVARRKLDESPWTLHKLRIKGLKYIVYTIIAWFLASTALAYFIGRESLFAMMADYPWHNWPTFLLTLAMMGLLLFQFGWFREQFCTVVCPYARFQSVLLDDSSLVVGYDVVRGEPRGKLSTKQDHGDCIDCGLCVRVCPTGIDIRNGLQLECIQCAACADACDSIMAKIERPLGLIRYDTERGLAGDVVKFLRPRVVVYGVILLCLVGFFAYSLKNRVLTDFSIFHSSKDSLFSKLESGELSNHLELHIANKSEAARTYRVKVEEYPNIKVVLPVDPFPVQANSVQHVPLFVIFSPEILSGGKKKVHLLVSDDAQFAQRLEVELLGPG